MNTGTLNLLLGQLPSYTRKSRHLEQLFRYADLSKLSNVLRSELARVKGDIVLHSRPYIYTIDTGNVCNLRCPLCPTGYRGLERNQALMRLRDFETIIDRIRPYAIEAILHNWGEPFLNPDILPMVRYARKNRIGTTISSNLNLVNRGEKFLEEVVESGLDHLTVSIDGTTQDVYETYRKGGHLEHVLENVRYLLRYRSKVRSSFPKVEWQFLVMKHNEHQMDDARRMAREIGVDRLRFTGAGLPFNELKNVSLASQWISELPDYRGYAPEKMVERGYLYDESCFYLYRAMTVNPDGAVAPCCALYHSKFDFGNLIESSLEDVWNGGHYRASRALFSGKSYDGQLKTACHECPLFKYHSSGRSSGATAAL
jgi:radical SAM protein with 4Fe4S-binding SPASM domain